MGQKENENVVMLVPMTFRVLEAVITHDPTDPLWKLDPSAKQALEDKERIQQTNLLQQLNIPTQEP